MKLCNDLKLVITSERGQVRLMLRDELDMTEVEVCQELNVTTHQSRRYHVREAVLIALRRLVSDAFAQDLISDSLGEWRIESIDVTME